MKAGYYTQTGHYLGTTWKKTRQYGIENNISLFFHYRNDVRTKLIRYHLNLRCKAAGITREHIAEFIHSGPELFRDVLEIESY